MKKINNKKGDEMMLKKRLLKFAIVILTLIALGFIFRKSIMIVVADVLYDNKRYLYSCKDLPNYEEVVQALEDNKEFVKQIEDVEPGFIDVYPGTIKDCPGKGDIHIYFPGHSQREIIEELIGSDLLFGIPYRMTNI